MKYARKGIAKKASAKLPTSCKTGFITKKKQKRVLQVIRVYWYINEGLCTCQSCFVLYSNQLQVTQVHATEFQMGLILRWLIPLVMGKYFPCFLESSTCQAMMHSASNLKNKFAMEFCRKWKRFLLGQMNQGTCILSALKSTCSHFHGDSGYQAKMPKRKNHKNRWTHDVKRIDWDASLLNQQPLQIFHKHH